MADTTSLPNPASPDSPLEGFTNRLGPVAPGAWTFFRRMRVIVGGQITEDIDYYHRVHQMLEL